jgi:hypothetical protein
MSSMPQLTPLRQPGQAKPLIWKVTTNPYIGLEARAYPANQIPKLNRADSQRVWVIFHQERGSRAKVLGVLAESAPDLYRVICYGEIPCSADDSLDFEWQAGIDTLYTYHQERTDRPKPPESHRRDRLSFPSRLGLPSLSSTPD